VKSYEIILEEYYQDLIETDGWFEPSVLGDPRKVGTVLWHESNQSGAIEVRKRSDESNLYRANKDRLEGLKEKYKSGEDLRNEKSVYKARDEIKDSVEQALLSGNFEKYPDTTVMELITSEASRYRFNSKADLYSVAGEVRSMLEDSENLDYSIKEGWRVGRRKGKPAD
jgi:hypothetical protein